MTKSRYKRTITGIEVLLVILALSSLLLYTRGYNWIVYNTNAGVSFILVAIPVGAALGFGILKISSRCKIARSKYALLLTVLGMTALYTSVSLVAFSIYVLNQRLSGQTVQELAANVVSKSENNLWGECELGLLYNEQTKKITTSVTDGKGYSTGESIQIQRQTGYFGYDILSIKPKRLQY